MFKFLLLIFILTKNAAFYPTDCFGGIMLTVYRDHKKVVLQRATTINDEEGATEIIGENQNIPVLQAGCIKNLPKLKSLILARCSIKNIEQGAFLDLPNIRLIRLAFNNLCQIKNGIFHSLDIVQLSLMGNDIEDIQEHAFYNLTYLKILDLSRNKLFSLTPDIFYKTENLRQINLSHNKILYLEDNFFLNCFSLNVDDVTSLIDLSFNNITHIEKNSFKGVFYVDLVQLNDNRIEYVHPDAFGRLRKGKTLDLRDNNLNRVPDKIHKKFETVLYDMYPIDHTNHTEKNATTVVIPVANSSLNVAEEDTFLLTNNNITETIPN